MSNVNQPSLKASWVHDRLIPGLTRFAQYFFLTLGALLMIFPFYWMFTTAFKDAAGAVRFPPDWIPQSWHPENFTRAFEQAPFGQYFLNSILITAASVLVTGITTIFGAFAFARLKFPGRTVLFSLLLSLMMVPFEMLVITNYATISKLNLIDTKFALVVPFMSSIFYTYILRNFFASVPDSLYWSARVDGSTNWQYLWKVMVPIARPSLMTIVLLNAISSWNSFMWPMLITNTKVNRTLTLGLYVFMSEDGAVPNMLMAASTIVVVPIIILFLFCRKQIINGVARGGLKG
ncbi:MAG: carbohydrate ABC transporter permease [Clostridia bacterium]|nr:carbohydrate ABC transporter permease [Clostridia bacterium]